MNDAIIEYTQKYIKKTDIQGKTVLEVGSRDINGSIRSYIESLKPEIYIGIDKKSGKDVDVTVDITKKFNAHFEVVICLNTLEHIRDWKTAINKMKGILRPNGLIYICVPTPKFHYHAYPFDWWRWYTGDIQTIFRDFTTIRLDQIGNILLFIGRKIEHEFVDISDHKLYSILRNKQMESQTIIDLMYWHVNNLQYLIKTIYKLLFIDFNIKNIPLRLIRKILDVLSI